jgi:hypothetical protein
MRVEFLFLAVCLALATDVNETVTLEPTLPSPPPPPPPTLTNNSHNNGDSSARRKTESGANFDLRHCEGAHDVEALIQTRELPPADAIKTHVDIRIDEKRGRLLFVVTVPYLAYNVHYTLDFVGTRHKPPGKFDRCSSNFNHHSIDVHSDTARLTPDEPVESDWETTQHAKKAEAKAKVVASAAAPRWRHAPNAKYGGAFSSPDTYATYYVDEKSHWKARAHGCSHVVYEAEMTVADCDTFNGPLTNKQDTLRQMSGVLRVMLTRPRDSDDEEGGGGGGVGLTELAERVHFARLYEFVLYVDRSNNKILLSNQLIANEFRLNLDTVSLTTASDNDKRQHLLIEITSPEPLLAVSNADATSEFVLQASSAPVVTSSSSSSSSSSVSEDDDSDGETRYRVLLLADSDVAEVFDGRFSLLFRNSADNSSQFLAHLSLFIAAPHKFDLKNAPVHVQTDRVGEHSKGTLRRGQRACMQTYVVAYESVTRVLQIELLRAQLCSNEPGDVTRKGWVGVSDKCSTIYDIATPKASRRHNVSIEQPGLYGPSSVIVCFDADERLTVDETSHTYDRFEQRYHSTVRFLAANPRAHYTLTLNSENDLFAALDRAASTPTHARHSVAFSNHVNVQHELKKAFSSAASTTSLDYNSEQKRGLLTKRSFRVERPAPPALTALEKRHAEPRRRRHNHHDSDSSDLEVDEQGWPDDDGSDGGPEQVSFPHPLSEEETNVAIIGVTVVILFVLGIICCVHRRKYNQLGE